MVADGLKSDWLCDRPSRGAEAWWTWGRRLRAFWIQALLRPSRTQCLSGCSVAAPRPVVTRSSLQLSFVHSKWVSGGHRRGDSPARSPLGRDGGLQAFVSR